MREICLFIAILPSNYIYNNYEHKRTNDEAERFQEFMSEFTPRNSNTNITLKVLLYNGK